MNDRPIDKVRNSALSITLPPDTGGVTDMGEINGALHMIGGSAIYRVQVADEIDAPTGKRRLVTAHPLSRHSGEPAGSAGKPPFYRTFAPGEANLYPVDPISTRGALELILERHWREEGRAGSDGRNSKNDYVR